tara:strand:+ start:31 stop:870 length:840 start_codon:yes stop_codon:yes gene_type:complete
VTSSFFLCKVCGKEIPEHDVKFSSDGKTVLTPDGVPEDIFCSNCEIAHIKIATEKKSKKKPSSKKGRLDYGKMKVAELKEILKSKKLPVSGPKWQLIERLTDKNWKKKEKAEKRRKRQPSYSHTKKTQIIVYIKFLIIGLISVFIFSFILNLLIHSPFEGGYFHEDYDKNTTTNNIFEIDFRFYANTAVFCSVIIIVFTSLMGAVLVSSGQDNVKKKSNEQSFALIYIASLIFPIAGIIIGAIYLTNKNEQTREAGTNCLVIAIISTVAYWVFIFDLFF